MAEKYILKGIFTEFSRSTRNRPYYTTEEYAKVMRPYKRKVKIEKINDQTREI